MKISVHRSGERGIGEHGWLHSRFSFSFADYQNPDRMGFGALRVLNDDIVEPSHGFDMHPHRNFEIISIVLEGSLDHKDSKGNSGTISAGQIQRISAGSGLMHSEYNHSHKAPVKFLQLWVQPKENGIEPSYETGDFSGTDFSNRLVEVVSGKKKKPALYLHQDAALRLGEIAKGKSVILKVAGKNRGIFAFLVSGKISIGKTVLLERDSAEITGAKSIAFKAAENSRILVIDVPMA